MSDVIFNPPTYPNLAKEMARTGLSQTEFARYLGISPMSVSERMRGKTEFKFEEMLKTSKLFDKSIEELFAKNHVKG